MTTNTTDQQLTLPSNPDANDVVTSMTTYNTGVETRLVKRYLSAADRTARNPTPNAGELSYRADGLVYEAYISGTWQSLQNLNGTITRVKTQRLTAQSVAAATFASILWTSADEYDTDGIHDTAINADRVVFNKLGLWVVSYSVTVSGSATGTRASYMQKNGAGGKLGANEGATAGTTSQSGATQVVCGSIGDYVTVTVFQGSAGALNYAGDVNSYLAAYYVGP